MTLRDCRGGTADRSGLTGAMRCVMHPTLPLADGLPFLGPGAGVEFAGRAAFWGQASLQSNRIMLVPCRTSILTMRWSSAPIRRSRVPGRRTQVNA
jgi:hypothetical protein